MDSWDLDPATGRVSYGVSAAAEALRGPGELCYEGSCQLRVEAGELDAAGEVVRVNRLAQFPAGCCSSAWSSAWELAASSSGTDWLPPFPVTHVRAVVVERYTTDAELATAWYAVSGGLIGDLAVDEVVAVWEAISVGEICSEIALIPGLPSTNPSSVNDLAFECMQLAGLGLTKSQFTRRLLATAIAIGISAVTLVAIVDHVSPDLSPNPDTGEIPASQQTNVDRRIGAALLEGPHSDAMAEADDETRRKIAATCRALAKRAYKAGALPALAFFDPEVTACESMPIFIPGSDAPQAARHKSFSIHAHPRSFVLTSRSSADKDGDLLAAGFQPWENWRQRVPLDHAAFLAGQLTYCGQGYDAQSFNCDEYPYHAAEQGTPVNLATPNPDPADPDSWKGFTLDLIPREANREEGRMYGIFKDNPGCPFRDPATGKGRSGIPFLVVPMPAGPLPTSYRCPVSD